MKEEEWYDNSSKDELIIRSDELEKEVTSPFDEYYEMFPYSNIQGKALKVIYIIKSDELEKKVTSPFDEYYEMVPYSNSESKALKVIYVSLNLMLQLYKETCSPCSVHPSFPKSKNQFMYMMQMHRKRL
jgi:hypothetical protein